MIPIRPLPRQALTYLVLFASFVSVTPQNVTVDDAVLTGAVVPQYLPSESKWNIGNNCSMCLVRPDPSLAYNGTWHDTTFDPQSGLSQAIQFTFTGSALYVFFILANTVPNSTTLTDVSFNLDGATVGTFVHSPSTSTDYQYNVPVYVNESLPIGEHSMIIEPVNSGNSVLMLFDYLVYTADTDSATTSSSVLPSSPSTLSVQDESMNSAALIGGTVGGVGALAIVAGLLYCYERRGRRRNMNSKFSSVGEEIVLSSPSPLPGLAPTVIASTSEPLRQMQSSFPEHRGAVFSSQMPFRFSSPPESVNPPSTSSLLDSNLREEAELLRSEIYRLRNLKTRGRTSVDLKFKAPSRKSSC